ncbi:hypothetical protein ACVPRZ_10500, partial [Salmonella enterica subsp. enterica serovar Typhimurium]
ALIVRQITGFLPLRISSPSIKNLLISKDSKSYLCYSTLLHKSVCHLTWVWIPDKLGIRWKLSG